MTIWQTIQSLQGQVLHTLAHHNAFEVVEVQKNKVIVQPAATGVNRPIKQVHIEDAFAQFQTDGEITMQGIRYFCEMSPVYIAAFIAQMPGVVVIKRGRQLVLTVGVT